MLTPHQPSKSLHAPRRPQRISDEDLADVQIVVVASNKPTEHRPAARAKPSGRTASINARPPA